MEEQLLRKCAAEGKEGVYILAGDEDYLKRYYRNEFRKSVVTDESFAVFSLSEEKNFPFLMGCNTLFCSTWVASTALGCVLNNFLPPIVADSCAIAFYAAFLAMLIPVVRKSIPILLLVLLTAAVNTLLQVFIPSSWAVVFSMVGCAAIGTFFVPAEKEEEPV